MTPASAIQPPADQAPRRSETDRAIAAAVTDDLLACAANLWGGEVSKLVALRAVQNFVYAADLPQGPSILRLTHDSYRSVDEVEAELQFIEAVAACGLSVSEARPTSGGTLVESIESSHGNFIATCFVQARGAPPDPKNPAQWNESLFDKWGAFIAGMHNVARAQAWTPASLRRNRWSEEIVVREYQRYVPQSDAAAWKAFDRLFAKLRTLPESADIFGLTHADFHHGNFLVESDRITLFDFDDSCFHWFAHDLAVAIYHLPRSGDQSEHDENARRFFRALIRGYRRVAHIEQESIDKIPLFLKWRDLVV